MNVSTENKDDNQGLYISFICSSHMVLVLKTEAICIMILLTIEQASKFLLRTKKKNYMHK